MSKHGKKAIAGVGFIYGLALAFYAVAWGVDGPTLTMPLAASPLNIPAAIVDKFAPIFSPLAPLLPMLIVLPILAAPFCWAAIALLAACTQHTRRRLFLGAVLLVHYIGIAVWFAVMGRNYLLRPFRILIVEGTLLLAFYAAGQIAIWWALLHDRT